MLQISMKKMTNQKTGNTEAKKYTEKNSNSCIFNTN